YNGVTAVCASRYALVTQDRRSRPPRSPTIVGRAVATIVESSAASSITSIRPPKVTPRRRFAERGGAAVAATVFTSSARYLTKRTSQSYSHRLGLTDGG